MSSNSNEISLGIVFADSGVVQLYSNLFADGSFMTLKFFKSNIPNKTLDFLFKSNNYNKVTDIPRLNALAIKLPHHSNAFPEIYSEQKLMESPPDKIQEFLSLQNPQSLMDILKRTLNSSLASHLANSFKDLI